MRVRALWVVLTVIVSSTMAQSAETNVQNEINVLPADLIARQPAANWVSYNGDYSGRRYSELSQINTQNVEQLRAEWVFHSSNSDRLEVTPIVVNGMMFVTSANDVVALDARTGRI